MHNAQTILLTALIARHDAMLPSFVHGAEVGHSRDAGHYLGDIEIDLDVKGPWGDIHPTLYVYEAEPPTERACPVTDRAPASPVASPRDRAPELVSIAC